MAEQAECTLTLEDGTHFDLSSLGNAKFVTILSAADFRTDYVATTTLGLEYKLNVCRSVVSEVWKITDPSTVGGFVNRPDGDFSIGSVNSTISLSPSIKEPLLIMPNGAPCPTNPAQMASSAIHFICDPTVYTAGSPTLVAALPSGPENEQCAFFFEWRTHIACPTNKPVTLDNVGHVVAFIVILFIAIFTWFGAHTLYNFYFLKLRGREAFPLPSLSLPSLTSCMSRRKQSVSLGGASNGSFGRGGGGFWKRRSRQHTGYGPVDANDDETENFAVRFSLDDDDDIDEDARALGADTGAWQSQGRASASLLPDLSQFRSEPAEEVQGYSLETPSEPIPAAQVAVVPPETVTSLPAWPPALSDAQLDVLVQLSSAHALAHGFTLLPQNPTDPPTSAIAAPLSLFPTPFPRKLYHKAKEIQPLYNALYARIALDWEFLDRVMGGSVAKVDSFQGDLWNGWKQVRDELVQPLHLGIFRSDYLLHDTADGTPMEIKQVEFNTIAASFGALSELAGNMHRYLSKTTHSYFSADPQLADLNNYPANESLKSVARGLAEGWKAYGNPNAKVLFVVQKGERNVFDQKWLEWELLERRGVHVVRYTFEELQDVASLEGDSRVLMLPSLLHPTLPADEVAVIYYRAAYTPNDYPDRSSWDTRLLLERSRALKCPSMALQLAGAKKVQQVLCEDGVLEDFLLGDSRPDVGFGKGRGSITDAQLAQMRETWTGLWPLDTSFLGEQGYKLAQTEPARFVLKPQREGGGNNIYRDDIPPYLKALEDAPVARGEPQQREGYVLMELIEPPKGLHNWLVRGGEGKRRKADVVSELGIYGVAIFGNRPDQVVNREGGTLLRTKGRESDEGGVAIGISSIDSPLLVV